MEILSENLHLPPPPRVYGVEHLFIGEAVFSPRKTPARRKVPNSFCPVVPKTGTALTTEATEAAETPPSPACCRARF